MNNLGRDRAKDLFEQRLLSGEPEFMVVYGR